MALSLKAWLAIVLACALVATAAFAPRAAPDRPSPRTYERRELTEAGRLRRQIDALYRALTYVQLRDSLVPLVREAAGRSGGRPVVLIDAGLDAAVRERLRGRLEESLGPFAEGSRSGIQIAVAVVVDTLARVPGIRLPPWDEIVFLPPEATDGRICMGIWLARQPRGLPEGPPIEPPHPLSDYPADVGGPCAFYAVFGRPGPGIARWLDAAGYALARHPQWVRMSGVPEGRAEGWYDRTELYLLFAPYLLACASGDRETCRVAILGGREDRSVTAGPVGVYRAYGAFHPLTHLAAYYLSDLVLEVGPERFARFWTSGLSVEEAFETEFGVPLAEWTRTWARRQVGEWEFRRWPRVGWIVFAFVAMGASVAGTAWWVTRRQIR